MPFTAADCKRLTGTDQPSYYTTPASWALCKNLNLHGPTPCWHPHCDCMPELPRSRVRLIWDGFIFGLAAPCMLVAGLFRRFK